MTWVATSYIYGIQSGMFIKVGYCKAVAYRLRQFQLCNPHPCRVAVKRAVDPLYARSAEIAAHKLLKPYAVGREWFMTDAATVRDAVGAAIQAMRDREVERVRYFVEKNSIRARDVRNDVDA